jgi:hypothetical protein
MLRRVPTGTSELWHDCGIDCLAQAMNEFDVATFLAGFGETGILKTAINLAK